MAHVQKPDFVFRRKGRVHSNQRGRQFSRLLAAEVCASAVVMLDTTCSEVVWRVLVTHSIRQFPLHFPSRASPCAITFQLDSINIVVNCHLGELGVYETTTLKLLHKRSKNAGTDLNCSRLDARWSFVQNVKKEYRCRKPRAIVILLTRTRPTPQRLSNDWFCWRGRLTATGTPKIAPLKLLIRKGSVRTSNVLATLTEYFILGFL
jgi:hypothetical protein